MWFFASFLCFVLIGAIFTLWFTPLTIGDLSMYSTLKEGDVVLINRFQKYFSEINRGDIVVYRNPETKDVYIKRVIAVGGEKVKAEDNRIIINNNYWLEESYSSFGEFSFSELEVPEGSVFVLSDNRQKYEKELMSRKTEIIRIEEIIGIVKLRIFPFTVFSARVQRGTEP
jgi:signal peptidase I